MTDKKETYCKVEAVNEELGLVMGYAMISRQFDPITKQWDDYYDLQGDHIPELTMFNASADFMKYSRQVQAMHDGKPIGTAIFAWPLTEEINKGMRINTEKTGFMLGVKIDDPDVLSRYKSGEYGGFSMGGLLLEYEEEQTDG